MFLTLGCQIVDRNLAAGLPGQVCREACFIYEGRGDGFVYGWDDEITDPLAYFRLL